MLLFNCVTKIEFQQRGAGRNLRLTYNFVNSFECTDSWENMTNTAKITLPKNVKAIDQDGKPYELGDLNKNIGGFTDNPLFLKGDRVTITCGYAGYPLNKVFEGYITGISSKKPFIVECENNMWILKQTPVANKVWPAKQYTMESMVAEMLKTANLPYTVNIITRSKAVYNVGDFRTQNETISQVLERFKSLVNASAYFRGSELRIGTFQYLEQDAVDDGEKVFMFQRNIISDELTYMRKDDVAMSAVAYSVTDDTVATGAKTKDGHSKTKQQRLEVLVYAEKGVFKSKVRKDGDGEFPTSTNEDRKTFYYYNKPVNELIADATETLKRYYYTGFKGKFTTFAVPFVKMGDNVKIIDRQLPERNGMYKVKSLKYTGGIQGLRQEIQLEYLITGVTADGSALPITNQ
jgi:hypothetical protein